MSTSLSKDTQNPLAPALRPITRAATEADLIEILEQVGTIRDTIVEAAGAEAAAGPAPESLLETAEPQTCEESVEPSAQHPGPRRLWIRFQNLDSKLAAAIGAVVVPSAILVANADASLPARVLMGLAAGLAGGALFPLLWSLIADPD